jgi:PPM family protein phosphatase
MTAHEAMTPAVNRKPRDDEIDVYGLTHPGKVRKQNQDHFLICSLRKQVVVHLTSLPDLGQVPAGNERVGFLAMVADGVGGGAKGEEASRLAVAAITDYVTRSMRCYYAADPVDDQAFSETLERDALQVHETLLARAADDPDYAGMATTLTLWLGVWPRAYLLQVGDSRCYVLRQGVLSQISRDQTMAQELYDMGVFTRTDTNRSPFSNVLSSAVGGKQTAPVVTQLDQEWGNVGLLCSDGLTKHVPDERIRERLLAMTSAKQVCEALLQDALDAGGSDNITVLVGRAVRRDPA